MKKTIYGMLNQVETDFTEYDKEELTGEESMRIKNRLLREVKDGGDENTARHRARNYRWIPKAAAAAMAVVIVAGGGTALAKGLFSDTIEKIIDNSKGTKNEAEDTGIYSTIGKNSVSVQEEVDKAGSENYVTTVTSNGITITVSDIFCDGYQLCFTGELTSDNEDVNRADGIITADKTGRMDDNNMGYIILNGIKTPIGKGFERAKDGSFVFSQSIGLKSMMLNDGLKLEEGKPIEVEWVMPELTGMDYVNHDSNGEYLETAKIEGDWNLKFPVTVDSSGNKVSKPDAQDKGVVLQEAVVTKAGLVLTVKAPDMTKAPFYDPYNDPDVSVVDSQGNNLQFLEFYVSEKNQEDGSSIYYITALYNGEQDLRLKMFNKNVDGSMIVDIPFQIP